MNDLEQLKNDLIQFKENFLFDKNFKIDRKDKYSIFLDIAGIIIWFDDFLDKDDVLLYFEYTKEFFPELNPIHHYHLKGITISLENFNYVAESRKLKLKILKDL